MSHPILYNKNIKNRVNLKKSFLLSTLIHIFLIFGVSFIFIYKQPLFDSSPVVNIKLANANIDQDPEFLPQVNNLINGNGSEPSELNDAQNKQKTLKVKMLDANSEQNTIESKYLNAWQRKIERVGHNVLKREYPQLNLSQLRLVVSIDASGNLYDAMSDICKTPLATSVPDKSAAGTLNLSKKNMNTNEAIINIINSQWF